MLGDEFVYRDIPADLPPLSFWAVWYSRYLRDGGDPAIPFPPYSETEKRLGLSQNYRSAFSWSIQQS